MTDKVPVGTPEEHKKWLGIENCTCPNEWAYLGKLYNVSMGYGWVRSSTEPGCPEHDKKK